MNTTTKTRNILTTAQRFALMTLIHTEYTKIGDTDAGFARVATERLGFEVTPGATKTLREGLGLKPIKQATVAELKARVAELEKKLAEAPSA